MKATKKEIKKYIFASVIILGIIILFELTVRIIF